MLGQMLEPVHFTSSRIRGRHGENLVIGTLFITHAEHAEWSYFEDGSGEAVAVKEHEHVERVSVFGVGAGYEAVRPRIMHGAEQGPIELEDIEGLVVLVLVA